MSGKSIATIYFYIISAASLALIVIGIFSAVNFGINSTFYDKYPLRYGPPGDCETLGYPYPAKMVPLPGEAKESTPSAEELKKQKEICEKQQESERKQHKIGDIRNALTFTLIGVILFLIHFPQAKKFSKD